MLTWTCASWGGTSGSVQDRLKNVQHIHATTLALAAILEDESVVFWGLTEEGGAVVLCRGSQAAKEAFPAIRHDGAVVTWGNRLSGATTALCKIS